MDNSIKVEASTTIYTIMNLTDIFIFSFFQLSEIVENIKWAVLKIINEISWMDDETRNSTIRKLEYMKALLGFPDNYIDILNNSFVDVCIYSNTYF